MSDPRLDRKLNVMRIYELAKELRDYELDDDDLERISRELIEITGICQACHGGGLDGEPPDANGVWGGVWACDTCDGTGFDPKQIEF